MTELLIKAALAYALGNLMGGHILGRLRGIDLAQIGSGNVGATNALRTQGSAFAVLVLSIDVLKGVLGALAIPSLPLDLGGTDGLSRDPQFQSFVCGAAVTLGHCYPAAWKFRGGKGVATLAGVFGAVLPASLPWILVGFALIVMLSGYVSLATLGATALAGFYVACIDARGAWSAAGGFTAFMALLVVFKHRDNIRRLLAGSENRFDKLRVLGRWRDR